MHNQSMTLCSWRSAVSLSGKDGETAAQEFSIVLLQMGSAEKHFLATYINAYLKKSIHLQLFAEFRIFHYFSLLSDSRLLCLLREWV